MINFLLLMIIPVLIAVCSIFYWKGKITLWEFALQLAAPAICVAFGLGIAYCQSTSDVEVWNGRITAKRMERVSCRHSYQCNCTTHCSGGKNESCYTTCQTCYEHSFDQDWNVFASTGESLSISTIDRQGLKMPPRWGMAYIGEPFSSGHTYTNYILANPESVLLGGKGDVKRFGSLIPVYPQVYDYYRTAHFINVGVPITPESAKDWEWVMDEINGDLGPQKQVQILLLLVRTTDPKYMLALKDSWIGGKKNDLVVVIGSEDGRRIAFTDVLSWTPSAKLRVLLKDSITAIGTLDKRDNIAASIRQLAQTHFVRMQMKDYQYLMRSFQPSSGAMIFLFVLGTMLSIGITIWCVVNDEQDYEPRNYRYRRLS